MSGGSVRNSSDRNAYREMLLRKLKLRLDEASFLLGCHPDTVRRWVDEGKVQATRTPGGHRRILTESVRGYL